MGIRARGIEIKIKKGMEKKEGDSGDQKIN